MEYIHAWKKEIDEILTEGKTDEWELPEAGVLSGIQLHLQGKCKAGAANYDLENLIYYLTKFKVEAEGDKLLFEARGEQATALNAFDLGQFPHCHMIGFDGQRQRHELMILFGRYLYDTEYALDLERFDKLELQITNTLAATEFQDNESKVSITYHLFEPKGPIPSEYLKTWEAEDSKPRADGQYVKYALPTRHHLRRIYVHPDPDLTAATAEPVKMPTGDNYNFELTYKEGSITHYDCPPKDMFRLNALKFGNFHTFGKVQPSTTIFYDTRLGYVEMSSVHNIYSAADTTLAQTENSQDRFQKLSFAGTADMVQWHAYGMAPYNIFTVDYDWRKERADWYVPDDWKPGEISWKTQYDDHTLRVLYQSPKVQGEI